MKILFSLLIIIFLNTILSAQLDLKNTILIDSSKVVKIGDKYLIAYQSINKTKGSQQTEIKYANLNFETIGFDQTKWNVKPKSHAELNRISYLLTNNPALAIEIVGNTDDIGNNRKNTRLSHKRALSVKKYLVKSGIHPSRIKTKGLGDKNTLCENPCKKNRRVEFFVYGDGTDLNKSWLKMYSPDKSIVK